MAINYIKELKKIQPSGPYIIGGECVGGSVAIEIAQQLLKNGDSVKNLILMDTPKPGLLKSLKEEYNSIRIRFNKIKRIEKFSSKMYAISKEIFRLLKIYLPITRYQRSIIHVSESSLFYQRILLRYKVKKYKGDVTLIVNEEWQRNKPGLGWNTEIFPNLKIHIVKGNHLTRLSKYGKKSGKIITETISI